MYNEDIVTSVVLLYKQIITKTSMKKNITYEFVYTHVKMEKIHCSKYQLIYAGHLGKRFVGLS